MKNLLVYLSFNPNMGDDSILPLFFVLVGVGLIGALVLYILPLLTKKKIDSKDDTDKDQLKIKHRQNFGGVYKCLQIIY